MYVNSEVPIGWNTGQRRGLLKPDLLIVFDVDWSIIEVQQGYSIDYHGKPPDFVLEIASKNTGQRDDTDKRAGYANYGVLEYWRFDDTDGQYHLTRLAGDRLVNGLYQPIPIRETGYARYRGYSSVLNLEVCWEYGHLRFYDPVAGRYVPTYYEEAEARLAAEARIAELEAEVRRLQNR